MTEPEIDYELARPAVGGVRTVADVLQILFADPTQAGMVREHEALYGATLTITTSDGLGGTIVTPMEVAGEYLRRLDKIRARGEPSKHELFKER